jgi:DNA-binding GntR family transcriptional regulator
MAAQRVVVRRQGRGTFVAKHTNERSLFHFFHLVDANDLKELPISRIVRCGLIGQVVIKRLVLLCRCARRL